MLSAKHFGTVKGRKDSSYSRPDPFPLISDSLGHTAPDRERLGPELHAANN